MLSSMKYSGKNPHWPNMPSLEADSISKRPLNSCSSNNSCGSSQSYGSSNNNSCGSSNGSLSSPEIFEMPSGLAECCLLSGCVRGGLYEGQAMWVRMGCTNPSCPEVKQLHLECFYEWQKRFSNAVNNSRSRHFSDFPIPPKFMFLKNYNVLLKLCGCRCGNGILIHDFDQSSSPCSSSNEEFNSISPTNPVKPPSRRPSFTFKDRSASFTATINRGINGRVEGVSGLFNGVNGGFNGGNGGFNAGNGGFNGGNGGFNGGFNGGNGGFNGGFNGGNGGFNAGNGGFNGGNGGFNGGNGGFNGALAKNHVFEFQNELGNFNNNHVASMYSSSNSNNLQHILNNITSNANSNFYPPSLLPPLNNNFNHNIPFNNNTRNNMINHSNNTFNNYPLSQPQSTPPFPPTNPQNTKRQQRLSYSIKAFDFFPTAEKAAAGNIFHHRTNMHSFDLLPPTSRNSYHVRVEDEGPYGNDEIRCFILTTLSSLRKTSLDCVLCHTTLNIYDKYPLVDGTFFLSLEKYERCGVEVTLSKKMQQQQQQQHKQRYLNVVCLGCMNSATATCRSCGKAWSGSALAAGTMYNFDVFASMPCCASRYACLNCKQPAKNFNSQQPPCFSDSQRPSTCGHCGLEACHSVKPLAQIFHIAGKSEAE